MSVCFPCYYSRRRGGDFFIEDMTGYLLSGKLGLQCWKSWALKQKEV